MLKGSWLGPLIYIMPSCIIHKLMDDVTLTEVITKGRDSAGSNMTQYINHLELWSKITA